MPTLHTDTLEQLRKGKMLILVDDEDRENEGDLVLAAEMVTPEAINFMAMHARGLICLALEGAQVDSLGLPMMAPKTPVMIKGMGQGTRRMSGSNVIKERFMRQALYIDGC